MMLDRKCGPHATMMDGTAGKMLGSVKCGVKLDKLGLLQIDGRMSLRRMFDGISASASRKLLSIS